MKIRLLSRLREKILGLLGIGIISVGIISFYSLNMLSHTINEFETLISNESRASALADEINFNFKRQVQEWKNVLLRGTNDADREKYWRQFTELHQLIQQDIQRFYEYELQVTLKK